ncbi:putative membrane protein [Marmoricola sp. OAE513]|uniref:anthrone oxygenase family protein n=1 Tax=Marmoricola sp. OAE513 TaxID=2817894 RepID=UPI001AE60624
MTVLAVLVVATVTSGILAGAFLLYAHAVMPALRRFDDAAFVHAFARLDRAIVNPVFLVTGFLGAPVATAVAAALTEGDARLWVLAALTMHVTMVVVTAAVNVPRNDALKAADAAGEDPTVARTAFDEARWARWNLLRVLLSTGATVALARSIALCA